LEVPGDITRSRREAGQRGIEITLVAQEVRQVFAQGKGDGGVAAGSLTALAGPRRFLSHRRPLNRFAVQGSASAEPAPGHSARQTEMLEIRRIVEADARGNHVLFPRWRRKLHPLHLADDLEHAVAAMELRTRLDVLPAEQETHEVRRR